MELNVHEGLMATECHDDLRQTGSCAVTYNDVTTCFNFENHKRYTVLVQGERENTFPKIIAPDKVPVISMEIGVEVSIPGSSVCWGLVIGVQNTGSTRRQVINHLEIWQTADLWQHRWEVEVARTKKSEQIDFRYFLLTVARGGVVVKALRYKPVDRGFDSRRCHWNFSVT